ncbi:MAG: hypothetical protein H7235_07340, partial [Bdellovibrionaceae bacterium]|nr:hypothetical protein [Pseudobdellovibrionaceae bacterium]
MIQDVLNRYILQSAQEVQFRLGHKTSFKKNREWIEADTESLSLSEWEDLKDLCLRPDEKMFLETKGYIRGIFSDQKNTWIFSFVEWKENLKAYFSYVSKATNINNIQNPAYLEALKNKNGIHIVSGFKQSGKSTLIRELVEDLKINSPQQIVLHSDPSILTRQLDETVFQLGADTLSWETTHPFYDGVDVVIVDMNDVSHWEKWIQFAEEGKKVFITMAANSVENVLLQVRSHLSGEKDNPLWQRFVRQLSSILNQKIVGLAEGSVHEILVLKA